MFPEKSPFKSGNEARELGGVSSILNVNHEGRTDQRKTEMGVLNKEMREEKRMKKETRQTASKKPRGRVLYEDKGSWVVEDEFGDAQVVYKETS